MGVNRWVLLMGLARGRGHWGIFAEKLKEKFPDHEFEFLDLPGNGERCEEVSPLKISDYVKKIRAQSQFVQLGEKFQIISISLGAMVSVEWMREFPHEVRRAYLICTSSAGLSPIYHRLLPANLNLARKILMAPQESERENMIMHLVANSKERRDAEFASFLEYSTKYPIKSKNVLRQIIAASQYRFPKEPPGEIHLIGSYGDRMVSPQCTLSIAKQWGMKPKMHPWAGHDLPVDDPRWLLEQLL